VWIERFGPLGDNDDQADEGRNVNKPEGFSNFLLHLGHAFYVFDFIFALILCFSKWNSNTWLSSPSKVGYFPGTHISINATHIPLNAGEAAGGSTLDVINQFLEGMLLATNYIKPSGSTFTNL
jgi:hypothetical protein